MPLLSPSGPAYVALLSAFFALFFASSVTHALTCLPCDLSKCKVAVCKGSKELGVCGCCQVCARQRNEPCGGVFGYHGTCDRGLTCVGSIGPYVGVCEGLRGRHNYNQPAVTVKLHTTDSPVQPSVSVDPAGEVVEGSKVTLTCRSDANPPVDIYTWYRDNRSISTGPQLVKDNVSPADSGQYLCQGTNKHGSQRSSPHDLDVQYGPKNVLLAVSSDGDFVKGSSVTFTCNSSGSNPPTSYIIFINRTVVAWKKIETISNIQPNRSGTYYCQAWNNISTVISPGVTVDVYSQPISQPLLQPDQFSQCGRPEPGETTRIVRGSGSLVAIPGQVSEIIGGRGSFPRHHPWQVSLQHRTIGSSKRFTHACGGVLIASCWVLTAAHCIDRSKDMRVVLGRVYIKRNEDSDQVIPVVRAIVHEDYRQSRPGGQFAASHSDIALLQLNVTRSPLCAVETRYVKTACLPNQPFPDGKECVVSGWGRTGNNKRSNRLLEGKAPLISNERCIAYQGRLDDTMICAGNPEGGVDACQGDSGGPLMCEQDGIHYIAGLVSWGPPCNAVSNIPGVYTNVYRYVDWIKEKRSNDDDDDYDYYFDDDDDYDHSFDEDHTSNL